jgi:N-acyl-D-amino-acid deacylase
MTGMKDRAMRDGAFGVSSGLEYIPGVSSRTGELVECARAARYGGIYAMHMRSEGDGLLASVEEAIRIGRESGAAL